MIVRAASTLVSVLLLHGSMLSSVANRFDGDTSAAAVAAASLAARSARSYVGHIIAALQYACVEGDTPSAAAAAHALTAMTARTLVEHSIDAWLDARVEGRDKELLVLHTTGARRTHGSFYTGSDRSSGLRCGWLLGVSRRQARHARCW